MWNNDKIKIIVLIKKWIKTSLWKKKKKKINYVENRGCTAVLVVIYFIY